MTAFTVEELAIPATLDLPGAADFLEMVDVRNAVEQDGYGTDELAYSAAELLPGWSDTTFEPKRLFVVRIDGRVVARGVHENLPDEPDSCWHVVQVLPAFRNRGVGRALSDRLEEIARSESRKRIVVYAVSRDGQGERLPSPTGFGSVPADNAEVLFLLGRGYTLEQVERGSRLPLPLDLDRFEGLLAAAVAASGPEYRVHLWGARTPVEWREQMVLLYTRMSTDAPTAGLEEPEDTWTVERLVATEERDASSPRTPLVAAVEHLPTARLAGYTELSVPAELSRPVGQEDTLVLREHRGKRLGMLLKLSNLEQLRRTHPGHPAVMTFNAEENRHMLSVNEALGFEPMCYEGAWKKLL